MSSPDGTRQPGNNRVGQTRFEVDRTRSSIERDARAQGRRRLIFVVHTFPKTFKIIPSPNLTQPSARQRVDNPAQFSRPIPETTSGTPCGFPLECVRLETCPHLALKVQMRNHSLATGYNEVHHIRCRIIQNITQHTYGIRNLNFRKSTHIRNVEERKLDTACQVGVGRKTR